MTVSNFINVFTSRNQLRWKQTINLRKIWKIWKKMIMKLHECLLKVKYMPDEKLLTADVFSGVPVSSEGKT